MELYCWLREEKIPIERKFVINLQTIQNDDQNINIIYFACCHVLSQHSLEI